MTTNTLAEARAPRTYGHWRKPKTPGLPRLGLLGTALALGSVVVALFVQMAAGLVPMLGFVALALMGLAPLLYRNRADRNGWQIITANALWAWGRSRRQQAYLAGLTTPIAFGAHTLPGLLAPSRLVEATDAYGIPFALVHIPATRHYTVVLRCDPEGSQLVDSDVMDNWVAHHGQWLADLGHQTDLVAAAITIETAPDPGFRLANEVERLLVPDAPDLSQAVLRETARMYPSAGARVSARVALTFSARRPVVEERERLSSKNKKKARKTTSAVRTPEEMAADLGQRLPGLIRQLQHTGAGVAHAMDAAELADIVRVAYDPQVGESVESLRESGQDTGVRWESAGPSGAVEEWGAYRHDSGASITWQMVQAPKGTVQCRVLERLLAPSAAVTRKRVSLVFRPHDPITAAAVADSDVRTALGRAAARPGESRATETAELMAARQAAREEAAGAGIARFSMLVTATVDDPAGLPAAAGAVDRMGQESRVLLRRCYGNQSAAFSAALGVGVVLPSHVNVPSVLREWM